MIGRFALAAAFAATLLFGAGSAQAADPWPTRPVKLVAPSAPGGLADTIGRLVAQQLTDALGQNFTVENRAGAGGMIGSDYVAHAAPDGYTYVISAMATHVLAPAMSTAPTFDPIRDFTHVALLGGTPNVVIVSTPLPIRSLRDLLEYGKSRPSGVSYGSPGVGTVGHLTGELLKQISGAPLVHVPYRGAALALADVMGNQIPSAVVGLTTATEQIRSGAVRAVALTSKSRLAEFPDLPTFAELGFRDLIVTNWLGLSGPANVPEDIARKLNIEVNRVLTSPATRERLLREAIEVDPLDLPATTAFMKAEIARWAPIVKASGAKLE